MEKIREILNQLMETPAVNLVNLEQGDIIKTDALVAYTSYKNKNSKKELCEVTYRDFIKSFCNLYKEHKSEKGMFFSFIYDWMKYMNTEPILKQFADLDYNSCVDLVASTINSKKLKTLFLKGVNNIVYKEIQSRNKNATVGNYINVVAAGLVKAIKEKPSKEEYNTIINYTLTVTYFNLFNLMYTYAVCTE